MAKRSGTKRRSAKSAFSGKDTSFDFGANAKPRRTKAGGGGSSSAAKGTKWNGAGSPDSGGGSIRA